MPRRFDEADDAFMQLVKATRWPRSRIQVGLVNTSENRMRVQAVLQRFEWPLQVGFDLLEDEHKYSTVFVFVIGKDEAVLREVAEDTVAFLRRCLPDIPVNFSNNY